VATTPDHLPEGTAALKAALIEARAKLVGAEALIEHLQLVIAKMKREMFGPRSERSQRLIDQMELQLEELAAAAGEDEAKAAAARVQVPGFTRRQATRRNFPADLPRRRIVHPAPATCPCCGGSKLSKIGEDVTETLDVVPRQWFVTQHVREKFSCRSCETITQPPAPFHAIARGFAGPSLLAMMLVEKYANHQPLNRQSEEYAREGIELSVSTMADHVGACAATLRPLYELIKAHVFAAERIHGDDTTVPVLAKVKTRTGRIWTYVRDDRPFGFGVDRRVVDTVTPFGVLANQHGQVLLLTFTVLYLAQVFGVSLGTAAIVIVAVSCLISGAAAVGGGPALAPILAPILLNAQIPDALAVVVLATTQPAVAPLVSLLTVLGTAALTVITAKARKCA
jgi:transposase